MGHDHSSFQGDSFYCRRFGICSYKPCCLFDIGISSFSGGYLEKISPPVHNFAVATRNELHKCVPVNISPSECRMAHGCGDMMGGSEGECSLEPLK